MQDLSLINIIFILCLSLIPTIIMLGVILYSDRKSSEPLLLILTCALSGFFTITLALFIQKYLMNSIDFLSLSQNYTIFSGIKTFILASVEEYCKLLVLYLFISHTKSFDDIYDGFVYSAIISLSFAGIETVMYVFKELTLESMSSLALLRAFTSIPLHLVCGIIMGYYIALEKFSKTKKYKIKELFKSMLFPIIIHSTYNLIIIYSKTFINNQILVTFLILAFLINIYIIGYLYIRKNMRLNEKFIKNRKYPGKYNFLMNKREFNRKLKQKKKLKLVKTKKRKTDKS